EREGEAQPLMVVGYAAQAILSPAVRPRPGVIVRKVAPGRPIGAVVLPDRAPLPLREVGAPSAPVGLPLLVFDEPLLLFDHRPSAPRCAPPAAHEGGAGCPAVPAYSDRQCRSVAGETADSAEPGGQELPRTRGGRASIGRIRSSALAMMTRATHPARVEPALTSSRAAPPRRSPPTRGAFRRQTTPAPGSRRDGRADRRRRPLRSSPARRRRARAPWARGAVPPPRHR